MDKRKQRRKNLSGIKQYRIIPSRFPPINIFERLVDPKDLGILWAIEALTNDRLREEAGELSLVPPAERVTGPGSSIVMAAFTHIGRASRFTNGSYGVYYAATAEETAIRETVFHHEHFMSMTHEAPCENDFRCYIGKIVGLFDDIRSADYDDLHHPDVTSYHKGQAFAGARRSANSLGLYYRSVRHIGGECIAAFRANAISIPVQGKHFRYQWNGHEVEHVFEIKACLSPHQ